MQVIVNKLLINYQVFGKGQVVVLVHGWGDDLVNFNLMQKELSKSYKVISLDLPGFGKSSVPDSGWSLNNFSEFIKDFVTKLDVKVFTYIGHSNGGAILINGLADSIINSEKLVLIASAGIRSTDKLKKKALLVGSKIGKLPLKLLPTDYQKQLQKRLYKLIKSDAGVNPAMLETFKKIVKQDVTRDATKIKIPTLIIYSKTDKITPPEYGKIYHKLIDNSQLELIDSGGHFVHIQEPSEVELIIEGFLK